MNRMYLTADLIQSIGVMKRLRVRLNVIELIDYSHPDKQVETSMENMYRCTRDYAGDVRIFTNMLKSN